MMNPHIKEFSRYTILNVLGMLGLSCYILADTFFISLGLGANGLTALNLAIPVYSFIHGCALMLGMGGATKYTIAVSQGKSSVGNQTFTRTILLEIFFALCFAALGLFFSGPVTQLLGADAETYAMTKTYLQMLLLFSPAFLTNEILLCFVRNDGAPQLSMFAMLGGSFSNIILDYIFIFPLGMGIFGAVFATCLAPVISLAILSPFFLKRKNHFHLQKCPLSPGDLKTILASGVPSLVSELSSGIVIIVFNLIMLRLGGNIGVAAYGVVANLSLVILSVYTGVAQGSQPLLSKYFGKEEPENLHRIFRYAVCTITGLFVFIYLTVFFGADAITAIFNSENNPTLQSIASYGIRVYFTGCGLAGFNILLSIYLTSVNKAGPAGIISILRGILLIVPVTFLLSAAMGITGLWLAFPVTELIVTGVGFVTLKHLHR